jgi:hypothetical protein
VRRTNGARLCGTGTRHRGQASDKTWWTVLMKLAGGAQAASAILLVEQAQEVGAEKDFPHTGLLELEANDFPAESPPDEPLASLPIEAAIGTDPALAPADRISPDRQTFRQGARAAAIMFGGWPQAQGFMGTQLVVTGPPTVGAALVGWRMSRRLAGNFGLVNAMHLFMARIVLRMCGPAKLDANTQPPPPDRKAGKTARANSAKRRAVVHADDFGQTVTSKHSGQRAPGLVIALVGQKPHIEKETAFEIADRQGLDPGAVAGAKPALEIHRPDVVGRARHRALTGRQRRTLPLVTRTGWHQFEPPQPSRQGAGYRQTNARMQATQTGVQFTRTPGGMTPTEPAQGRLPAPRQLSWRMVRPTGTIAQTDTPLEAKALPPFVSGGAGDVETATKLSEGLALNQSREDEPFTSRKKGASKPRHARHSAPSNVFHCPRCPGPALSTMSCPCATEPHSVKYLWPPIGITPCMIPPLAILSQSL